MHIKQGIRIFLFLYGCLILFSCSKSKMELVHEYERYIAGVEAQHSRYSKRDWITADKRIAYFHTMLKRYERDLSQEEKKRIHAAFAVYHSYRNGIAYPFDETEIAVTESEPTDEHQRITEPEQTERDEHAADPQNETEHEYTSVDETDDRVTELERITRQQEQISLQLEQLRKQLEDSRNTPVSSQTTDREKTEQERLIDAMQNDLLMGILKTKKQGWRDVSGAVKILVFPAHYKGHRFTMDYTDLSGIIQNAVNIILSQARRYNQQLSIDWEFMTNSDGSYASLSGPADGLNRYAQCKSLFSGYDQVSVVYAVDMAGRSYCSYRGTLGRSEANAVLWFKDSYEHSAGTLAHELFHTFGADDLYYEEGVVPQEVEANFKKLLGDSIMLTSSGSSGLDPINAWLIGWNKKPEPWYAWFIDRREPVDVNRFE